MRAAVFALVASLAFAVPPAKAPRTFKAAPGPDAEYLSLIDRYEVTPAGSLVHEREARVRLNTYAAINRFMGESRVAWNPRTDQVEVLRNQTVLPSGARVTAPANAVVVDQPHEVNGNPLWGHLRNTVIVHTALEPGAVVEFTWRVTHKASAGFTVAEALSQGFPVAERRVEVRLPKTLAYRSQGDFKALEAKDGIRTLRFAASNLPAAPFEAGAPAESESRAYATVALGALASVGAASDELQRRVAAAGPAPTRALELAQKAADAELNRERKLQAALGALSSALNVASLPLSITNWELHPLAQVWEAGWASPLEMAALQARVLKELGFDALPVLVRATAQSDEAPGGFALHERAALGVKEGGDFRLLDPKDPLRCLSGPLHLIPAGAGPAFLEARPWRRHVTATLTVEAGGTVKGDFALETEGSATPLAGLVQDPQKVAEQLANGLLAGAKVKSLRVTRLAPNGAALAVSFEAALPAPKAMNLVTLAWPGVPGGVSLGLPVLPGRDRQTAIQLPGPGEETLELRLVLPKGWELAALPVARMVSNACGEAVLEARVDKGILGLTRRLKLGKRLAEPKEATAVRALLTAWNAPDSRELLLRKSAD